MAQVSYSEQTSGTWLKTEPNALQKQEWNWVIFSGWSTYWCLPCWILRSITTLTPHRKPTATCAHPPATSSLTQSSLFAHIMYFLPFCSSKLFFWSDFPNFFSFPSLSPVSKKAVITGMCIIFAPIQTEPIWVFRMTERLSTKETKQRNKHWPDIFYN